MAVAGSGGVEKPGEFKLCFWGESLLVLEEYDLVFVKGVDDHISIGFWSIGQDVVRMWSC